MGRRTIRIVVVVLLFATAAIAWRMLRDIDRQHDGLASEADAIEARLDRIAESLHGIGAAQLTYVAPGQPGGASFERVSTLLRDYQEDIMAVGPALQPAANRNELVAIERLLAVVNRWRLPAPGDRAGRSLRFTLAQES